MAIVRNIIIDESVKITSNNIPHSYNNNIYIVTSSLIYKYNGYTYEAVYNRPSNGQMISAIIGNKIYLIHPVIPNSTLYVYDIDNNTYTLTNVVLPTISTGLPLSDYFNMFSYNIISFYITA